MKKLSKEFQVSISKNGNILICDNHKKPTKEISIFDENGKFLNNISEQQFRTVVHFNGSENVFCDEHSTMQECANLVVSKISEKQKSIDDLVIDDEVCDYDVDLQLFYLEKLPNQKKAQTVVVRSSTLIEAIAKASDLFFKLKDKPNGVVMTKVIKASKSFV